MNRNILAIDYDELTLEERVNAIREAREQGRRFAADDPEFCICDCAEPYMPHTCPPDVGRQPARATPSDYTNQILDPAYQEGDIPEDAPIFAEIEQDDGAYRNRCDLTEVRDPRVVAFITAADEEYRSITQDFRAHKFDEQEDCDND